MATLIPKYKTVTVTTAGTPVPILGASDAEPGPIVSCWVQAKATGDIIVGDGTTAVGIKLLVASLDKMSLSADGQNALDLRKVMLDASVNGSTASVLYFIRV